MFGILKLSNSIWFIVTALFFISNFTATHASSKEATIIDILRSQYISFEAELWSIIENGVDQNSVLHHILHEQNKFVNTNLTIDYVENEFFILEQVYEWKILEKDLISINNLFDAFRILLQKNIGQIDRLEIQDFTETVLNDKQWSVNSTLEQIENIMIKQGLYYKVMLVRTFFFIMLYICYCLLGIIDDLLKLNFLLF